MSPVRLQRPRGVRGWTPPPGAVWVGPGSRWATPFRFMSRAALARVPALDGAAWELEDRCSAAGMSHPFYHPDGRITPHQVRYMTLQETVELYRQALTAPTRDIHLTDPETLHNPTRRPRWLTVDDARRDLAGRDLVCRCSLRYACHVDVLLDVANSPAVAVTR